MTSFVFYCLKKRNYVPYLFFLLLLGDTAYHTGINRYILKLSDQDIVKELKNGNTRVFKNLYDHFPMIASMVIKNNGSKEDAKDLFQNALIIFYKNVLKPDFQLTAKLSSYLYAICDRNWKKILTRDKHRHQSDIDNITPPQVSPKEFELASSQTKSLKDFLQEILENIGEPCKSLLIMHEFQKLNMTEIKEKMGYANEHTARQQKYKCIQKIKKSIPKEVALTYLQKTSHPS